MVERGSEREGLFWVFVSLSLTLLVPSAGSAHPPRHHEIERITEALQAHPERVDLWLRRSDLYRRDGNHEASLSDLATARRWTPGDPAVDYRCGLNYAALGRDEAAERELTRSIDSGSAPLEAYTARAQVRTRRGRLGAAIVDYSSALRVQPKVELYVARGELAERLERWAEAARGYREGMVRLHRPAVLVRALVEVEVRRGHFEDAVKLVDRELQRESLKTSWYLLRAEVLTAAKRPTAARMDFEKALGEANRGLRRRATALNLVLRARAYLGLGDRPRARADLLSAIGKAPRFERARELLVTAEGMP